MVETYLRVTAMLGVWYSALPGNSGRCFVSLCFKYPSVMAGRTEIQNIMRATIQLLWELWMCPKERNWVKLTESEQANTVNVKGGGNTEKEKHQWEMRCRTGVSMRKSKNVRNRINFNCSRCYWIYRDSEMEDVCSTSEEAEAADHLPGQGFARYFVTSFQSSKQQNKWFCNGKRFHLV